jgi:hypothetical protein
MKRVRLNGAAIVAEFMGRDRTWTVYQAPDGGLFTHCPGLDDEAAAVEALTVEEAAAWVASPGVDVNYEAPKYGDAGKTMIAVRVPMSMKRAIDAAVMASGMPLSEWLLRALEAKLHGYTAEQRARERFDELQEVQDQQFKVICSLLSPESGTLTVGSWKSVESIERMAAHAIRDYDTFSVQPRTMLEIALAQYHDTEEKIRELVGNYPRLEDDELEDAYEGADDSDQGEEDY